MEGKKLKSVICVLNPDDVFKIKEDSESKCQNNLMTPYEIEKFKKDNDGILFPETIREGAILMLSDDKKGYHLSSDEESIISKRICAIQLIVSYLGGVDFKAKDTHSEDSLRKSQMKYKSEIDGNYNGISGSFDVNLDVEAEAHHKKNGEATLESHSSGLYTKEGYKRAVEIADKYGLRTNPVIENLLDLRHPAHPNPIDQQTYEISLISDFTEKLDVVENIQSSISSNFSLNCQTKLDIKETLIENLKKARIFRFSASFGNVVIGENVTNDSVITNTDDNQNVISDERVTDGQSFPKDAKVCVKSSATVLDSTTDIFMNNTNPIALDQIKLNYLMLQKRIEMVESVIQNFNRESELALNILRKAMNQSMKDLENTIETSEFQKS